MAVEFWAAIFGAIVGGIATLVGSVVVGRRELVRTHRIEIYRDLLPAARDMVESHLIRDDITDTWKRTAEVAGRREAHHAADAIDRVRQVHRMKTGDWHWLEGDDRSVVLKIAQVEALRSLDEYSRGLRRRIR